MSKYIFLFIFSVFISCCSQILLKISSNKKHESFIKEYLNLRVILGYGLLFLTSFITILCLKYIPLKRAPSLEAAGYIFILILSKLFLNEKISNNKVVGNILIIIGILVFNLK